MSTSLTTTDCTETSVLSPATVTGTHVAVLIVVGNASTGGGAHGQRLIPIGEGLEIGRRPKPVGGRGAVVIDDRRVSSRHARLDRTSNGWELTDLDSTNGTLLDGQTLSGRAQLRDGALIFVGAWAAVFRLQPQERIEAIAEDFGCPFGPVSTGSPTMAATVRRLRRLARTSEEVLLVGETGVGKEVYARAVHEASGRTGKLVALNCAAIPTELVESELFGYLRGAHSQAASAKAGLIEQAAGGTLFLDEIGEMPPVAQAKLLRFLQDREFTPLGGVVAKRVDVRVIAATHRVDTSDTSGLRDDLLGRLGAEPLLLPPLRARPEDIGALCSFFLKSAPRRMALDPAAFLALCLHTWPRNVRELQKVIREAVIYAEGRDTIALEHLPSGIAARVTAAAEEDVGAPGRRRPRPAPSRAELEQLLQQYSGNIANVARDLDRQWAVVWRWVQRHGIDVEQFKGSA